MRLLKTLLTIQLFYDTGKHTANDTVQKYLYRYRYLFASSSYTVVMQYG